MLRRISILIAVCAAFAIPAATAAAHDHGDDGPPPTKAAFCADGMNVSAYSDSYIVDHIRYGDAAANGGYYSYEYHILWYTFTGYSLSQPGEGATDVVWHPVTAGACAVPVVNSGPDSVALCYSHSGTDTNPSFYSAAQMKSEDLLGLTNADGSDSYWLASATARTVAGDNNIIGGVYTLVCNPSTQPVSPGEWVGHDGKTVIDDATEMGVQNGDGPNQGDTRETQFYQVVG